MLSSKSSSRMRWCKDSTNPPSQGWPGGMNTWSVSCSLAQRPEAGALSSGPLSALSTWGASWAKTARSSISITSVAPMRRSTRKVRCYRESSSMTLRILNTHSHQIESRWKVMANTCPGALALTRGAGLWTLRERTRSPSLLHKQPERITPHVGRGTQPPEKHDQHQPQRTPSPRPVATTTRA